MNSFIHTGRTNSQSKQLAARTGLWVCHRTLKSLLWKNPQRWGDPWGHVQEPLATFQVAHSPRTRMLSSGDSVPQPQTVYAHCSFVGKSSYSRCDRLGIDYKYCLYKYKYLDIPVESRAAQSFPGLFPLMRSSAPFLLRRQRAILLMRTCPSMGARAPFPSPISSHCERLGATIPW